MLTDPASLDRLRDIFEPEPVSWWPLAPGWWVLLIASAFVVIGLVFRAWRRWTANAYRRAALRELQSATSAAEVKQILKRTALVAFPRTEVAGLSGSRWCEWLGRTGGSDVSPAVTLAFTEDVFRETPSSELAETFNLAAHWIEHHQPGPSGRQAC